MLSQFPMIGFIATTDSAKARAFYGDTLGFEFQSDDGFALVFHAHGNMLRVAKMKEFTPQSFTVLGWEVTGIHEVVQTMTNGGVSFEKYSGLPQDALGIWTTPDGSKVAWFKDPDGNVLSVSEHPRH